MGDWTKVVLSVAGAVLLVALCAQLIFGAERTAGGVAFAAIFLLLLGYAARKFFRPRCRDAPHRE